MSSTTQNEKIAQLILVRGVPGSGKSTYARTLNVPHFEADMWFEERGGYAPKKLKEAHSWCLEQAVSRMESGETVVVSNTFTRLWELQPYVDAAKELGVEVVIIKMNGEWQNVHGVPREKVEQMRERFEPHPQEINFISN